MTDGSSTIYSPECGGWFLSNGTEVCGFATTSLLRTSVGIPGLAGIDRLLSFRIVHELRKFLKFYSESVKPFAVMLEQIRDGLFPEWKNTTDDGRLYNVAMKKTEKLMFPLLVCLRHIGQAQLLRKLITNELLFRSKLDANLIHEALATFDESLLTDIRAHYRDSANPIPKESNPLLVRVAALLDSNGRADPLNKVYVTTDPLEGLPVLLLLFTISCLSKLEYDQNFGALRRSKSSYPLDGWPLVAGMATILKQFHPSYTSSLIAYLGQFVKSTVGNALKDSSSSVSSLPKEVVNCVLLTNQLAKIMKIDNCILHKQMPGFIVEAIVGEAIGTK